YMLCEIKRFHHSTRYDQRVLAAAVYRVDVGFFLQAEDGIRDRNVTGVQTCALPILHGETGRAISNDPLYRKLFRRLCWPFAVDENQARLSTRSQFSEADVFGTCGAFPERRWVRRLTTTSTTTAAGSAGMTELIASARPVASHIIVTAPPAIIDASAPVAVTRFQNSAASTAGVMAAPYIVYAYICSASTDSKN